MFRKSLVLSVRRIALGLLFSGLFVLHTAPLGGVEWYHLSGVLAQQNANDVAGAGGRSGTPAEWSGQPPVRKYEDTPGSSGGQQPNQPTNYGGSPPTAQPWVSGANPGSAGVGISADGTAGNQPQPQPSYYTGSVYGGGEGAAGADPGYNTRVAQPGGGGNAHPRETANTVPSGVRENEVRAAASASASVADPAQKAAGQGQPYPPPDNVYGQPYQPPYLQQNVPRHPPQQQPSPSVQSQPAYVPGQGNPPPANVYPPPNAAQQPAQGVPQQARPQSAEYQLPREYVDNQGQYGRPTAYPGSVYGSQQYAAATPPRGVPAATEYPYAQRQPEGAYKRYPESSSTNQPNVPADDNRHQWQAAREQPYIPQGVNPTIERMDSIHEENQPYPSKVESGVPSAAVPQPNPGVHVPPIADDAHPSHELPKNEEDGMQAASEHATFGPEDSIYERGDGEGHTFSEEDDEHAESTIIHEWETHMQHFHPEMMLTFTLGPRSDEYFYEEVGEEPVHIRGGYFVSGDDDQVIVDVTVTDPTGEEIFKKKEVEGLFYFNTEMVGRYSFIISNHHWMEAKRVTFAIGKGSDMALQPQHLTTVDGNLDTIDQQLKDVRAESEYLWIRQRSHMSTVESMNNRVFWFAFLEMLCLLCVSAFQIYYIKGIVSDKRIL